jgi:hypothetical protein
MIAEETVSKFELFGPAIAHELQRANKLEEIGLYTEATMRLGRAIEASLYAVAREFGVSIVARSIEDLTKLRDALRSAEVNVMRKQSSEMVRSLSNLSKSLCEAIARLAEDTPRRAGKENDNPRPNEQILRDILHTLNEPTAKRLLEAKMEFLREIQDARNAGAHASLDGQLREVDKEKYHRVTGLVSELLGSLFDIALGERARKAFPVSYDK